MGKSLRSLLLSLPKRLASFLVAAFIILAVASMGKAATQNALVTGYVYDQNGAAVPGAMVRLINPGTGFSQAHTTDANGNYTFPSVPPASGYLLSVEVQGFIPAFHPDLEINVGDYRDVEPPFVLQPGATAPTPAAPPTPRAEVKPVAPAPGKPSAPAAPAVPPTVPPVVVSQIPAHAVRSETPTVALDFGNTIMGGVINSEMVRTLPLANRDFFELALLVPGTYPVQQGSPLEGASLVANGVRANMNNFLLDGVDNNDYTINQALPFQIVEAMQEFRVQTTASTAEYGRSGGAQVNTISRSGNNAFHGSLFEFNRNSALSSQYPLSAYSGGTFQGYALEQQVVRTEQCSSNADCFWPSLAMSDSKLSSIYNSGTNPHFNQNQFGGNVGGPIVKNRAFFFFNWESLRGRDPRPDFERVPDSTCRNFGACNSYIEANGYEGYTATPSTSRASQLLGLYSQPNVPASTVSDYFGTPVSDPQHGDLNFNAPNLPEGEFDNTGAFYTGQAQNYTDSDNALSRVDVNLTDRTSMSFKHNIQRIDQIQGGSIAQNSNYPGNGIDVNGRNQNFSFNLVQAFSDRLVNEARFGWNRFRLTTMPLDAAINAGSFFQNVPSGEGLPTVLIGGYDYTNGPYASLGAGFSAPGNRADSITSGSDSMSITRGRHVIKLGAEIRHDRLNVDNEGAGRGLVAFGGTPQVSYDGLMGLLSFASIARVSPTFGGGPYGGGFDRSFHANSAGDFIQDDWRATSNLTFTLGLRYELFQPPVEGRNRLVNDYPYICNNASTGLPSPVCLMQPGSRTILDSDGATLGNASFSPQPAGFKADWTNFAPHVGLAWHPGKLGNTVFRAGYALMYDQLPIQPSVNMLLNPPYVQQTMTLNPVLSDTFPAGFPLRSQCSPVNAFTPSFNCWGGGGNGAGYFNLAGEGAYGGMGSEWFGQPYSITARDPNTRTPYVHQVYAGVEHRLGNKAMFEVAYVGTLGHKLLRDRLLLQCPQSVLDYDNAHGSLGCFPHFFGVSGPNVFYGGPGAGADSDSVINQETSGDSNFHSLQARFETRSYHGLSIHAHYMWAHSIDDASGVNPPVFLMSPTAADAVSYYYGIDPYQLTSLNNANPTLSLRPGFPSISTVADLASNSGGSSYWAGERANSDFDIRQRGVIYYIYDLPRVRAWRGFGNGWQVAGVTTLQGGEPFSVYGDYFGIPLRPNLVGAPLINNGTPGGAIDNALPAGCNDPGSINCAGTSAKSAFNVYNTFEFTYGALPPSVGGSSQQSSSTGTQGGAPLARNSFTGPRYFNFDFSVLKNIYFGNSESKYLQVRAEFFNLFDRANYRQPYSQEGQFVENPCQAFANCQNSDGSPVSNYTVSNPFFGQILQAYEPREVQFAAKFIF